MKTTEMFTSLLGQSSLPWLLLVHLVAAVSANGQASWDTKDLQIKQGENLKVTCSVVNVGSFGVVRLQKINPATQEVDVISDDINVKTKFSETGRYNISLKWTGPDLDITLMYTGLRGEDMGKIMCFQLGKEHQAANFMLHVLVPIEEVYIMMSSGDSGEVRVQPDRTVHLRQGEESMLRCVYKRDGTQAPPHMAVEVGGQSEFGKFLRDDFPVSEDLPSGGWRESITVKLTYETMTPPADFNEKNLTCRGTVDGYPPVEASVRLNVQFAPIITCPKYEWFGQLKRAMTIRCDVHSNPGSQIKWFYGPDRKQAEYIEKDQKIFQQKNRAFSEDHGHVSLTIRRLNESHLTNFYLSASNDIDTKEVTVTVSEGARDTDPEVQIHPKDKQPSYNQKNKPSKRPRARPLDPQRVQSGSVSQTSPVSVFSLLCSSIIIWIFR